MIKDVFMAGATGFIGAQALAQMASSPNVVVKALARSPSSANRIETLGGIAIRGDLKQRGDWQRHVAEASVVVHVAQPATFGQRITAKIARQYEVERLDMDRRLFDALPSSRPIRVVYVAGNSYYGETGTGTAKDETMAPQPTGFGPYIQSAVAHAEKLASAAREVIVSFPGAVYGRGSWLKQYFLDPIAAGKPVMRISGDAHWASPIHVEDCGRAVAHLALMESAKHGNKAERFFLVDDQPATYDAIAATVAAAMGKPLKTRDVPGFMLGLFAGKIVQSYMATDSKYSNAKLRGTGFEFRYPTIETGIPSLFEVENPDRRGART